jgi:hypothetical protein
LARGFSSLPYWRLRAWFDCAESAANAKGKGFSREQFLQAFREIGIPENIPAAVYDYYGSQAAYKGFSFLPDDEYSKVFVTIPMTSARMLSLCSNGSEWFCCPNIFSNNQAMNLSRLCAI